MHFFEASLNTELAAIYVQQGHHENAAAHAKRAVFLDHTNQTAIDIMDGKPATIHAPLYDQSIYSLSGWLYDDNKRHCEEPKATRQSSLINNSTSSENTGLPRFARSDDYCLFTQATAARELLQAQEWSQAVDLYTKLIEQMENLHKAYHMEAAKPWLMRAAYFEGQGEKELAKNDLRRAKDLDESAKLHDN